MAMHDVPKYARMQAKIEFVAHEMVGILQNVSQNRSNKKITRTDIKYAVAAAYLSIYPGKTMYTTDPHAHPYGHFPIIWMYYVVGESDGNASIVWGIHAYVDGTATTSISISNLVSTHIYSLVTYLQNANPSAIHPKLRINPGERKIILECAYCYHLGLSNFKFSDGRTCANVSSKKAFGFWALPIKPSKEAGYFNAVVIFTPKPGLFDDNGPQ
jgi:hypothetical protein